MRDKQEYPQDARLTCAQESLPRVYRRTLPECPYSPNDLSNNIYLTDAEGNFQTGINCKGQRQPDGALMVRARRYFDFLLCCAALRFRAFQTGTVQIVRAVPAALAFQQRCAKPGGAGQEKWRRKR